MMAAPVPQFTLNNGRKVPSVGMGCWIDISGGAGTCEEMCLNALKNGYRHIDTAKGYGNEEFVGKAIRASGVPRSEIFLTTKLWSTDHGRVREAFEESFAKLDVEYIDLYLMHWPQAVVADTVGMNEGRTLGIDESPTFVETWKEMEKLLETGKVKSIGVSNFSIKNLEILLPHVKVVPVVNQVELHPFLPSFELQEYCEQKGILLVGYSPLGMGHPAFFEDPDYQRIVEAHKANPAQIVISWLVQRGIPTIPKSANVDRQKANITLVNLTSEEVATINAIHKKPGQHRTLVFPPIAPEGVILGWTYEQMGWPFDTAGVVRD